MDEESFVTLEPVGFFQYQLDCHRLDEQPLAALSKQLFSSKYKLPDLSPLCGEESFADVYLGWNKLGLGLHFHVNETFRHGFYPDVTRGDAAEVFIDTRDVKTSGHNTRYCHHFFCLAEPVDGYSAGELTHFRTEDAHEWCHSDVLQTKSSCKHGYYDMTLFIPASALVGYDPESFDRLGFSYRISRCYKAQQHFSASSKEYQIEQQPSLWSSVKLIP